MTENKSPQTETASPKAGAVHREAPHASEHWEGYTLDEIRYQRAYTLARMEINSQRLKQRSTSIVDSKPGSSRHFFGKILSAFSYVDLALMAWRIGSKVWQTSRIFKR